MSGLVLKLGPRERIMINGVVMENGDRRTRLNVLTPDANVLRLRDAIHPDEANTPGPPGLLHRPAGARRRGRPRGGEPPAHPRHRAALPGLPGPRQPRPPRRRHRGGGRAPLLPGDAGAARPAAARGAAPRARPAPGAMSFQPTIPLAGIAGWRFLERTQAAQQAAFEKGPELAARHRLLRGEDRRHHLRRRPRGRPPAAQGGARRLRPRGRDRQARLHPQDARRGHARPQGARQPADRPVLPQAHRRPSASATPAARAPARPASPRRSSPPTRPAPSRRRWARPTTTCASR